MATEAEYRASCERMVKQKGACWGLNCGKCILLNHVCGDEKDDLAAARLWLEEHPEQSVANIAPTVCNECAVLQKRIDWLQRAVVGCILTGHEGCGDCVYLDVTTMECDCPKICRTGDQYEAR